MPVTRNDVAHRAGVSPAVVSYVLNNGPRPVSASARQRVLEAIAELGYRPDGRARALRAGHDNTLGLVLPDTTNPFFAELARAIEDAAYAAGYAVLVGNSADDAEREHSYIDALAERRVAGLVLVSARPDQSLSQLSTLSIPALAMDRTPDESLVSTLRIDNRGGAAAGTDHLIEHGHTDVAFIGGTDDEGVSAERQKGWRMALEAAGLTIGPSTFAPFTAAGGAEAGQELLKRPRRPTAMLVSSDVQAIGVIHAAHQIGLRVPEDLALVAFDGTAAGAFTSPPLTSIGQPIGQLAATAVNHLIHRPIRTVHLTLVSELIVRDSCGAHPS